MTCAPSEDSDQLEHPPSLIRVFAVRMNIPWVISYPFSTQRRPWSDWALVGSAQSDLSLSLGAQNTMYVLSCCGIYISRSLSLGRTHGLGRLGLMVMLSHCQFQVASNFDYRRAQSVLRSTDDLYFVGLIPHLSHPFHSSFFLFPETLDISGIHYTQVIFGKDCLTESLNKPFFIVFPSKIVKVC